MENKTKNIKKSEYGKQLEEKQGLKKIYGIREAQLRKYVEEARKGSGNTGSNLLILLERRLDNTIYKMGFAQTIPQARQFATHGLFMLNGRRVDIPSILVKTDDEIEPRKKEQFKDRDIALRSNWLSLDKKSLKGKVNRMPEREEIDITVNENIVIQFYSR